jgi:hypothetical protein
MFKPNREHGVVKNATIEPLRKGEIAMLDLVSIVHSCVPFILHNNNISLSFLDGTATTTSTVMGMSVFVWIQFKLFSFIFILMYEGHSE